MTGRLATAIAVLLLAGCGGDEEERARTSGQTPGATQTTPLTGTTKTGTTEQTAPGATAPPRGGRPEPPAVRALRDCLSQHGYRATGSIRPPGSPDAPGQEILVTAAGGSAIIAFYDAVAPARRYQARLRRNARGIKGASVERQGTIITVWVGLTDMTVRSRIRDCVRQEA